MSDVIEYVRRSALNMTNLNTARKRKDGPKLYHIVENDSLDRWKLGLVN